MRWTRTEAHAVRRVIHGLNPRVTAGRPTAQAVYDALVLLAERVGKVLQIPVGDPQKAALRTLVDDLYRTEPAPGPAVRCMSWDYRQVPDLDELARIVADVSGGSVHLREVDDSSDEIVIAVSRQPLDDTAARAAWEANR